MLFKIENLVKHGDSSIVCMSYLNCCEICFHFSVYHLVSGAGSFAVS